MFKVDKREFLYKTMSVSLVGGLLLAIVLCMDCTHATDSESTPTEIINNFSDTSTSTDSDMPQSPAALTSVDSNQVTGSTDPGSANPDPAAAAGVADPAAAAGSANPDLPADASSQPTTDIQQADNADDKSQEKTEINYGEFPEEKVELSPSKCKFPGDGCVHECEKTVEKCHGDAHYSQHPDNCKGEEEPVPEYQKSDPPACPSFRHHPPMPWSCYPHHHMPYPYNPYHRPVIYHHPYQPIHQSNLSHHCNTGCAGYGFGPQRNPSCGPHDINRCFLEHSLKNPKAFEKLKNCSFH